MVDELLGRLEASTVKFDIGRGGIPELTPQDIDAALGMCGDKFAVAIYQAAQGGSVDLPSVDKLLAAAQFDEWRSRADRLVNAQIAMCNAKMLPRHERKAAVSRAEMMLAGAKAAMWPHLVEETYARMRLALLAELRSPRICPVCNGARSIVIESRKIDCKHCAATGKTSVSDRQRALMMRVNESSYRRTWKPVYEWMYRTLNNAISTGREQFKKAVSRQAA